MKASPAMAGFNSGELSPACEGRTDLKQYATGCYKLENFIPMVQGPARRRPGTRFVAEVKDSTKRTALIEFDKAVPVCFMIEAGDHYFRFYQNYQQIMTNLQPAPLWNPTIGGTTADGTVVWTNLGAPTWQANTIYNSTNNFIFDSNGNIQVVYLVMGTGESGGAAPSWQTGLQQQTYDVHDYVPPITLDGIIWWCQGHPQWQPFTFYGAFPPPFCVIDNNGNIQQATTQGISGAGVVRSIPYEISTPYAHTDLFDASGFFMLVFVQSADVIYITHRLGTFPTQKLSHFGPSNWTLQPVNFLGGPFATPNQGSSPIVFASGQTGQVRLTASANIFDPDGNGDLIGAYFQLTQQNIRTVRPWVSAQVISAGERRRYNGITYEAINGGGTTGDTPPTHISGQAWDGGLGGFGVLWAYRDPGFGMVQIAAIDAAPTGSAVAIRGITAATPPVVTVVSLPAGLANGSLIFITGVSGMTEVNDQFYTVAGLSGNTFQLNQADTGDGSPGPVKGLLWDPYLSGGTVDNRLWTCTANVVVQSQVGTVNRLPKAVVFASNATSYWAYGAFNDRDGYPNAVAFFEGRLALAKDGNVFLSVSNDFENFSYMTPGGVVTPDMGIDITLPTQDEVDWLVEGRVLVVGTENAEHVITPINSAEPLGPSNIASKNQMRHGSRRVRPALIGYSLLWTQTSGQKMRIMKYQFFTDQYQSEDLAAFANHIFEKYGAVWLAFQQEPDSVIWMGRSDGALVGFTFNEEQNVIAWHRHPMDNGIVEAGATIHNPAQTQDDLWMIVNRTISNTTKRYIEYMSPHFLTGDSLVTGSTYHDCGSTFTAGSPTTIVTGLHYLEGQTVNVVVDGAQHPQCVVAGGQIALNWAGSIIQVGLAYRAKLTTMPIEVGSPISTSQGKTKRISDVNLRLLNTNAGQIGREDPDAEIEEPPDTVFDDLLFRDPSDPMNTPVPIYNGVYPREGYDQLFPGGQEIEGRVTYRNDTSYPCTVASIYPVLEVED